MRPEMELCGDRVGAKKSVDGLRLDLQTDKSADAVEDLRKRYEALDHPAKGAK